MELFKAKHAVVKEELMIPIDPKALETLNKDELMTAMELKRLELLCCKVLHKFETFVQHVFKYPLVVVSVFKVGKTVLFCVFSRFRQRVLQLVNDKFIFNSDTESNDAFRLTLFNRPLTVVTTPERF